MLIMTVHIEPEPQKQTKFRICNGRVFTYDPSSSYIEKLQWQLKHYAPPSVYMGPVEVDLTFFLPIPKATSKVRRRLMNNGTIKHIVRPDLDNLAYAVTNAMKGIIYHDDSQVCSSRYRKFYGDEPKIVIKVRDLVDQVFAPHPFEC